MSSPLLSDCIDSNALVVNMIGPAEVQFNQLNYAKRDVHVLASIELTHTHTHTHTHAGFDTIGLQLQLLSGGLKRQVANHR
jgi:hypothetical protein